MESSSVVIFWSGLYLLPKCIQEIISRSMTKHNSESFCIVVLLSLLTQLINDSSNCMTNPTVWVLRTANLDQPEQPPSLVRVFAVGIMGS